MNNENYDIISESSHLPFIKSDAINAVKRLAEYAEEITKAYREPMTENNDKRDDMIMKVARIKGEILAVRNDDFLDKAGALQVVFNSVQDLIDDLKASK